jgi:hypothetical protein
MISTTSAPISYDPTTRTLDWSKATVKDVGIFEIDYSAYYN